MESQENTIDSVVRQSARRNLETTALFPGSFKPPNASHVKAIRHLVEDVGVDKIRIIVANRCRVIPGTNLALDADSAAMLFRILLEKSGLPLDNIAMEIAPHRAVGHVPQSLYEADSNSEYLLCVGEEDYLSADDRFSRVRDAAGRCGVSTRIEVLPKCSPNVHSSELRKLIASGFAGRARFIDCLPAEMSTDDKALYWGLCNSLLEPVYEIVKPKILASLSRRYDVSPKSLKAVDSSAVDPVFQFCGSQGQLRTVKYSGDTTDKGVFGIADSQMPARRLSVERRATRHLARHLSRSVYHSRIDYFDRDTRVMVLSGRPKNSHTIASELQCNKFDLTSAAKAGESLAALHMCPLPDTPFWGSAMADEERWHNQIDGLQRRAARVLKAECGEVMNRNSLSRFDGSARPGILHLNFAARHLYRSASGVAIENFECVGCYGDTAFDIATLITDYLIAGISRNELTSSLKAIEYFEKSYRSQYPYEAEDHSTRVATYCAHQLLCRSAEFDRPQIVQSILAYGAELVASIKKINGDGQHMHTAAMLSKLSKPQSTV